ncbi:hypothetical protein BCR44DRAFT_1174010 [Catenaria anguillulae PL171]|uniref:Uncharacterized protein n=1 Tax=Catenaria anguillulae PL171 TaxID=765915 RepID=A0A1Y2I0Z6_9FUNG|nr:hypothetical protein BCR44DRAFT_1174010 [Catenaria anguillulae PL171]
MYAREKAKARGEPFPGDFGGGDKAREHVDDREEEEIVEESVEEEVDDEEAQEEQAETQQSKSMSKQSVKSISDQVKPMSTLGPLRDLPRLAPIASINAPSALPKLGSTTVAPLVSSIPRLSSRESIHQVISQSNLSRKNSANELAAKLSASDNNDLPRSRSGSNSGSVHSLSAKVPKLKSNKTSSNSKSQLLTGANGDASATGGTRTRSGSQVSLPSPRVTGMSLPSVHSSAPQLETLQAKIDDQSAHITELEAELRDLRDRLRVADELSVERSTKYERELQAAVATAKAQSECAMNALRDGLAKEHAAELEVVRRQAEDKLRRLESECGDKIKAAKDSCVEQIKQMELKYKQDQVSMVKKHEDQLDVAGKRYLAEIKELKQQLEVAEAASKASAGHSTEPTTDHSQGKLVSLRAELAGALDQLAAAQDELEITREQIASHDDELNAVRTEYEARLQARDSEVNQLRSRVQALEQLAQELHQKQERPAVSDEPPPPKVTVVTRETAAQTDHAAGVAPAGQDTAIARGRPPATSAIARVPSAGEVADSITQASQRHQQQQSAPLNDKYLTDSSDSSRSQVDATPSDTPSTSRAPSRHRHHHRPRKSSVPSAPRAELVRSPSLQRPVLLKSRVSATSILPSYLETVALPGPDSELSDVEASLHAVMDRIQTRRRQTSSGYSPTLQRAYIPTSVSAPRWVSESPPTLPPRPLGTHHLDAFAAECSATERKLREHTLWLRTFLDNIEPTMGNP